MYNASKYISTCINSILEQTYNNFELILIDDGSIDETWNICSEYKDNDNRIHLYRKSNGGVSSARNLGLEKAKGNWITFIDADDWVGKTYIEKLLSNNIGNIDLIISFANIVKGGEIVKETYPSDIIEDYDFYLLFIKYGLNLRTSPWGKMYKREIINDNNLRFVDGMQIGEDAVFLYNYLLLSKKIYVSDVMEYYYRYDLPGTLTKRINSYNDELFVYMKMDEVVNVLIDRFSSKNIQAIINLRITLSIYANRVLNSLYHSSELHRNERLKIIKSLDLEPVYKYIPCKTIKDKLLCVFLKKQWFGLYDFLRMGKRLINNCIPSFL